MKHFLNFSIVVIQNCQHRILVGIKNWHSNVFAFKKEYYKNEGSQELNVLISGFLLMDILEICCGYL